MAYSRKNARFGKTICKKPETVFHHVSAESRAGNHIMEQKSINYIICLFYSIFNIFVYNANIFVISTFGAKSARQDTILILLNGIKVLKFQDSGTTLPWS